MYSPHTGPYLRAVYVPLPSFQWHFFNQDPVLIALYSIRLEQIYKPQIDVLLAILPYSSMKQLFLKLQLSENNTGRRIDVSVGGGGGVSPHSGFIHSVEEMCIFHTQSQLSPAEIRFVSDALCSPRKIPAGSRSGSSVKCQ